MTIGQTERRKSFCELDELREIKGMSVSEICRRSGKTARSMYYDYLNKVSVPNHETLQNLSNALGAKAAISITIVQEVK